MAQRRASLGEYANDEFEDDEEDEEAAVERAAADRNHTQPPSLPSVMAASASPPHHMAALDRGRARPAEPAASIVRRGGATDSDESPRPVRDHPGLHARAPREHDPPSARRTHIAPPPGSRQTGSDAGAVHGAPEGHGAVADARARLRGASGAAPEEGFEDDEDAGVARGDVHRVSSLAGGAVRRSARGPSSTARGLPKFVPAAAAARRKRQEAIAAENLWLVRRIQAAKPYVPGRPHGPPSGSQSARAPPAHRTPPVELGSARVAPAATLAAIRAAVERQFERFDPAARDFLSRRRRANERGGRGDEDEDEEDEDEEGEEEEEEDDDEEEEDDEEAQRASRRLAAPGYKVDGRVPKLDLRAHRDVRGASLIAETDATGGRRGALATTVRGAPRSEAEVLAAGSVRNARKAATVERRAAAQRHTSGGGRSHGGERAARRGEPTDEDVEEDEAAALQPRRRLFDGSGRRGAPMRDAKEGDEDGDEEGAEVEEEAEAGRGARTEDDDSGTAALVSRQLPLARHGGETIRPHPIVDPRVITHEYADDFDD